MIPVVMVPAPSQQEKMHIWLNYSKKLNPDYKIDVLTAPPSVEQLPRGKIQDAAFRFVLEQYAGQEFLWVEPDSIPIHKDWLDAIVRQYYNAGKPFMLPFLECLGDIGSGIGVYPPDAHWIIPQSFDVHAWDAWMYRNLKEKIHFTRLIQHSYGVYDELNVERRHAFPKDQNIMNENAVLFHSDPMQSLARTLPKFTHTGDIGDVIAILPIVKQLGGGEIIISPIDPSIRAGVIPRGNLYDDAFDSLKTLLDMQDYITGVHKLPIPERQEGYDFSLFRLTPRSHAKENLTQWQARAVGLGPVDESPWLKCGSCMTHERIVVARSLRYHNPFFPWIPLSDKFRNRLLFVGTDEEHKAFCSLVNAPVEHAHTPTLLDVAKIINGAHMVFCNQSAPFWIAAGLNKPIVQECWVGGEMNAIIKRDNIHYITTDLSKIAQILNIPL